MNSARFDLNDLTALTLVSKKSLHISLPTARDNSLQKTALPLVIQHQILSFFLPTTTAPNPLKRYVEAGKIARFMTQYKISMKAFPYCAGELAWKNRIDATANYVRDALICNAASSLLTDPTGWLEKENLVMLAGMLYANPSTSPVESHFFPRVILTAAYLRSSRHSIDPAGISAFISQETQQIRNTIQQLCHRIEEPRELQELLQAPASDAHIEKKAAQENEEQLQNQELPRSTRLTPAQHCFRIVSFATTAALVCYTLLFKFFQAFVNPTIYRLKLFYFKCHALMPGSPPFKHACTIALIALPYLCCMASLATIPLAEIRYMIALVPYFFIARTLFSDLYANIPIKNVIKSHIRTVNRLYRQVKSLCRESHLITTLFLLSLAAKQRCCTYEKAHPKRS